MCGAPCSIRSPSSSAPQQNSSAKSRASAQIGADDVTATPPRRVTAATDRKALLSVSSRIGSRESTANHVDSRGPRCGRIDATTQASRSASLVRAACASVMRVT